MYSYNKKISLNYYTWDTVKAKKAEFPRLNFNFMHVKNRNSSP